MGYNELYHHGVKGMKWGVRRDRQRSGGSGRQSSTSDKSSRNRKIAKMVAGMVIMGATVTAAAVVYQKNPQAINAVVSKVGKTTISALKTGSKKAIERGKHYVTSIKNEVKAGIKEGIKESVKEAPKKATKAVITGATMMAAKRMLDATVGREEAARMMQANNNKKISSFWKVSGEDKEDDD